MSTEAKLNISLEFSWRPRDVIITQKPTHQHFARHASHSRSLAEENKCISYSGKEALGEGGGGREERSTRRKKWRREDGEGHAEG